MSIPSTDWAALTELAERCGTTRTALIRGYIHHGIVREEDTEHVLELDRTKDELKQAYEQLDTIRRQLAAIANSAEMNLEPTGPVAA